MKSADFTLIKLNANTRNSSTTCPFGIFKAESKIAVYSHIPTDVGAYSFKTYIFFLHGIKLFSCILSILHYLLEQILGCFSLGHVCVNFKCIKRVHYILSWTAGAFIIADHCEECSNDPICNWSSFLKQLHQNHSFSLGYSVHTEDFGGGGHVELKEGHIWVALPVKKRKAKPIDLIGLLSITEDPHSMWCIYI